MPSFSETVDIRAEPEFIWARLTDTSEEARISVWPGVQWVEYDPPGEPLFVGQEMRMSSPSGLVIATCMTIDEAKHQFSHTIVKAPLVRSGWFGVELKCEEDITAMSISGKFECSPFTRALLTTALLGFKANFQKVGQKLTELAQQT